jgi:hypothetical protein
MLTLNLRGKQKGRVACCKGGRRSSRTMYEYEQSDGLAQRRRMTVGYVSEEPGAVTPHAGICGGESQ